MSRHKKTVPAATGTAIKRCGYLIAIFVLPVYGLGGKSSIRFVGGESRGLS